MIILQEFNSLQEIDPEFHDEIAALIPLEVASFSQWLEREKQASADQQFYYYLFFSSERNVPVGLAQAQITLLDPAHYLPWGKKLLHQIFQTQPTWKHIKWSIGSGYYGPLVISPKFYRQAKEQLQKKIHELEQRSEVVAQSFVSFGDLNPLKSSWNDIHFQSTKKTFYLDIYPCSFESYEQYLFQLPTEIQKKIKARFKYLYKEKNLGMERNQDDLEFFGHGEKISRLKLETLKDGTLKVYLPSKPEGFLLTEDFIQLALVEFLPKEDIKGLFFLHEESMIKTQQLESFQSFQEMQIPIKSQEFHHFSRSPYVSQ